jgi:hypothetical protein
VLAFFQFFVVLSAIQGTQRLFASIADSDLGTAVIDAVLLGILVFGFYSTHRRKHWTPFFWKAAFGIAALFLLIGLFSYDAPIVYAGSLAVCVAWLIYWSTSRRVALTFAERRASAQVETPSHAQAQSQSVPEYLSQDQRKCPHCGETIKAAARICKYCRSRLESPSVATDA